MKNETTPRRALIGNVMQVPSGEIGKVTGINYDGIARVALKNGAYIDVPQDELKRVTS